MKRITSKWTSIALIAALLFSLVGPLTAYAAIQLTITNLYTVPGSGPEVIDSTNDASVQRFTTNNITVNVTINGITSDKITNIYYEIQNLNTGITSVNQTNKAVINPANNNEVIFNNVVLTEGLNKITVKYGDTSIVSSRSGWAYFTPVTNITDLKLNGVNFVDNQIYPGGPPYTSLNISGTANNATQVQAYVSGAVYSPTVINGGVFNFITNTGRGADLSFTPGDNKIRFVAKNNSISYSSDRSFVYDNGRGFAFNALIDISDPVTPAPKQMVDVPTLTKNVSSNVKLNAEIKASLTSTGISAYDYVDVYTLGTSYKIRYDLVGNTVSSNDTPQTIAPTAISPNAAMSVAGRYNVFDFNYNLPVNNGNKLQQVVFEFGTITGGLLDTSTYSYYYINPNTPYVQFVDHYISSTDKVKLSELGTSQINEFPAKLDVYTTGVADAIEVRVGSGLYTAENGNGQYTVAAATSGPTDVNGNFAYVDALGNPLVDSNGVALKKATVNLQGISDGYTSLTITPMKAGATYAEGRKIYNLQISSTPYVIVNGLYTGKVFTKKEDIKCPNNAALGPCISGRFVNLPASEYPNVKLYINSTALNIASFIASDGTFTINSAALMPTPTNEFNSDGKKSIHFMLYLHGSLVTESTTDIFVLSDNVPLVNSLTPVEPDPTLQQFVVVQNDSYVTKLKKIQLKGEVRNSTRIAPNTQYDITYTVPGATAKTTIASGLYKTPINIKDNPADPTNLNFTEQFSTYDIDLPQYGDYTFEITATNASGVTSTKSIKITREALPYFITQPITFKAQDGNDQANINSNFQVITMTADGADSVVFGKDTALKSTGSTGDVFTYEAKNLKPGRNVIKFTVNRGTAKTSGSIVLNYANTPIEGAQYKTQLGTNLKIFNGDINLKFSNGTELMRNDRSTTNQFLTTERSLLFGIADIDTGQVDKVNDQNVGLQYLAGIGVTPRFQQIGRFKAASKRYWIDAGTIPNISTTDANYQNELKDALQGSGTTPMPLSGTPFFGRSFQDLVIPNQTATLTLKFDPSIRDDAWKYVAVFQYNIFEDLTGGGGTEQGWRNLGGVVDTKNNTITVNIDSFGYFQVMYMNNSFEDVTNHPWARDDLDTLYSKGYMFNKDPGGRFLPNDAITRGEFVTMLVTAFDIPLKNSDTFSRNGGATQNYQGTFADVIRGNNIPDSNGLYDYMHIEAAARAGIVRGSSQGLFLPSITITRQDAAVMIARAGNLKMNPDNTKSLAALQKMFTDANSIDVYARTAIEAVSKAGFIVGRDNVLLQGQKKTTQRFDPVDNLTRAEAATIMMRILKSIKKVP